MNIFEQYGIKEVANVQFEALEDDINMNVKAGDIVLFLDTLKISTLEQTAERTEARGGHGNPALIIWDFGKEITVNLQDALFSPMSLALLMGAKLVESGASTPISIRATQIVADNSAYDAAKAIAELGGKAIKWISSVSGKRDQQVFEGAVWTGVAPSVNDYPIRVFYDKKQATANKAFKLEIGAGRFPGTYRMFGDTFVRNRNGKDSPFQFIVHKAKMNADVTLSMEAEGDPSVFDMTMRVLRDDNGNMVELIKYED